MSFNTIKKKNIIKKVSKFKVISLFSGCGGLDLGFRKAGFKITLAIDNNQYACASYKKNFPECKILQKDIREIKDSQFPKTIDLIIGGYPCQGFSEAGLQKLDDERNFLYKEFGRCLKIIQPKMFLAENVHGLINMNNGKVITQMVKEFQEKNYNVKYKLINVKNYGIPQDRIRVFIIGVRKDLDLQFYFPLPSYGEDLKQYRTLKDAIWHLKENPGSYYNGSYTTRYMARQRKRMWNQVSYCIVASADKNPQHPAGELMRRINYNKYEFVGNENRSMSLKECLVIQTFPEDYILEGPLFERYRQVGNAVPPLLSEYLANAIRDCLNYKFLDYCDYYCKRIKTKVKKINFLDKFGSLIQIKLCKRCFEEEFKINWENYIPNIILK